jgi:hypothetical protein
VISKSSGPSRNQGLSVSLMSEIFATIRPSKRTPSPASQRIPGCSRSEQPLPRSQILLCRRFFPDVKTEGGRAFERHVGNTLPNSNWRLPLVVDDTLVNAAFSEFNRKTRNARLTPSAWGFCGAGLYFPSRRRDLSAAVLVGRLHGRSHCRDSWYCGSLAEPLLDRPPFLWEREERTAGLRLFPCSRLLGRDQGS